MQQFARVLTSKGSNGVALMRLLIKQKLDSFFFITADYAFGASLEADARDAIAKAGGTVVGGLRSPLNTADFSSFLIAAQASKAKVIVFAITGADLSNALKQASEFNLARRAISRDADHLFERRPRGRPRCRAWPHLHAVLVLGPRRQDARIRQAFLRKARPHAQRQSGRRLFLGSPLSRSRRQSSEPTKPGR